MDLLRLLQIALPGVAAPRGSDRIVIDAVTDDSRRVKPGSLFVAVHGTRSDGHEFVGPAVAAGAVAVVVQRQVESIGVPGIVVNDSRWALARLAATISGLDAIQAAGWLRAVGVTGTNGKTTTSYLVRDVLRHAGHTVGLLGTVAYDLVSQRLAAPLTTPPPTELCQHLVAAAHAGADWAVLEASSHALDQRRLAGVALDVGIFTNITRDHSDYHSKLSDYMAAKRRLFEQVRPEGVAILNADTPASLHMASACRGRVIGYGINAAAEVAARIERIDSTGSRFELHYGEKVLAVCMPLVGKHNISNALAAAAVGWALGIEPEVVVAALESPTLVPGRLQRVGAGDRDIEVFVDYAHTDDALDNVLSCLRQVTEGRLRVVFGCGGDRDRTKRPLMGQVAARRADVLYVTSDNPRTESPQAIIDEILGGIDDADRPRTHVEPDRRAAIAAALGEAAAGDVVLIAGKGHETHQVVGTERRPFDDVAVAAEVLR